MKDIAIAFLIAAIGFAKVYFFVAAVKRALRPRGSSQGDNGGYWPEWDITPWPIKPKPFVSSLGKHLLR